MEKRLTKLTTLTDNNMNEPMDKLYPLHYRALRKANLIHNKAIPTLGDKKAELWREMENKTPDKLKKRRERDRKRATFFKIGFSSFWRKLVQKAIKEIKGKFSSPTWLLVLYHTTASTSSEKYSKEM